jgi:hypothetical protein
MKLSRRVRGTVTNERALAYYSITDDSCPIRGRSHVKVFSVFKRSLKNFFSIKRFFHEMAPF